MVAQELSFAERFGREPTMLVRSPGSVNLVGEHTDYNLGYVLAAAIDRHTKLAAAPRSDNRLHVYSESVGEELDLDLDGFIGLLGEAFDWHNYVRGAVWWLQSRGIRPAGADVLIWGDLPAASGLASRASLLVGLLSLLCSMAGHEISRRDIARAAHGIANEFIGIPSGITDAMAVTEAQARSALLIDCRSLASTPAPLNLAAMGAALVVVTGGIAADPEDSTYARRRRECEAAIGALRVITYDLNLQSLRDITPEMLHRYGSKLYPTLQKRVRHVVTENQRVLQAEQALQANDARELGALMNESHASLSRDFEVSNPFIDRLVDLAQHTEGVLGARMTGGGLGGCTVNLVEMSALRNFERSVVRRYSEETSFRAESHVLRPVGGVDVETLAA